MDAGCLSHRQEEPGDARREQSLAKRASRRAVDQGAYLVFLAPPSIAELERRLLGRGTDSPERAAERLEIAREEMAQSHWFDEVLINSSVEEVAARLIALAQESR